MNVSIITFSPTGGTLRCATEFASAMGPIVQSIDLTDPALAESAVSDDTDAVVIAVPSYGGRVPALAAERLADIDGRAKTAVLMAVFGNRAFDDTLAELHDVAKSCGFEPAAAVSAIAQHCMDSRIATGRPDSADLARLREFGKTVAAKISAGLGSVPEIPGDRPYKKAGAGMVPVTDKGCSACGECASRCPAQAISHDDPAKIDQSRCIGCMRCVTVCPTQSKRLPGAKRLMVHTFLAATASRRKEPQLFA